tara:strand:+ start:13451 stop:15124 length:1674 start_codon:yes stop_codon:yes gene_type:complete
MSIDANIDDYDFDEILDILGAGAEEEDIKRSANLLKTKMLIEGKNNLALFIEKAKNKALLLLDEYLNDNEKQFDEDQDVEDRDVEDENVEDRDVEDRDVEEIDEDENIEFNKKINPLEQTIVSKVLAIDTFYRDENYPSSSDFIYTLPNPINNVVSMRLLSTEIPNVQNLFSDENKNNEFTITMYNGWETYYHESGNELLKEFDRDENGIKKKILTIKLVTGSPDFNTLIDSINDILDSQRNSFSLLKMGIDIINGKFNIRFKTLLECDTWNKLYFQIPNEIPIMAPDNKPPTLRFMLPSKDDLTVKTYHDYLKRILLGNNEVNKINSEAEYDVNNNIDYHKIRVENGIDPSSNFIPTEYIAIKNAISLISQEQSDYITNKNLLISDEMLEYEVDFNSLNQEFKRSFGWSVGFREYSKSKKINFYDTYKRNDITYYGYLQASSTYGNNQQNYFYLYVDDYVGNYSDALNVAFKDNSYLAKSLLARLQITSRLYSTAFGGTQSSSNFLEKERSYYGPVNIQKLHIKLLDTYGKLFDLKNINYGLVFQFDKYYSKINDN